MKIVPRISVRVLPHFFGTRYRLASWTRKNRTFGRMIRRMLFDEDDMIVLPKNNVAVKEVDIDIGIEDAGDRTVLPSDVVKGVISRSDDIFIMDFCLCRRSNKCKDFPLDRGCVFLGKGVHRIPKDFGHIATKDEACRYINECSDLGFVHIIGRNKLDSIWLSTGNKKDLMTICNCCPCCCLWNVARDISDEIADVYKRMDGVRITLNSDNCVGCGTCSEICFTKAIKVIDGKSTVDEEKCRCCGRCAEVCDFDAIKITYDPSKIDTEIERIASLMTGSDH